MTREEIIEGLKFTVEMFLLDPSTGETFTEPINDLDKTTIDACRGAIELLEREPKWIPVSERLPKAFEFVNCTCHSLIDDREDWTIETVYIPQSSDSPYSDWGNIPMLNSGNCEVVAWMHRNIPEPYRAESEDK